ncbi:MAG: hypothetical protein K6A44_04645 [bacterium]|nr:hypothetical protein [bacterium]
MIIPQVAPRALSNMTVTQRAANAIGSVVPKKVGEFFEMNQMGTLSRIPLLILAFAFVLGARLVKSRDEHERREVLTRDGATVGTAMVGVPILKNWVQRGIDKLTKIPVATEKNKFFALGDFGFDNIKNWYSKAEFNPEKALGVAKFIKERGGDVAKAFSALGDEGIKHLKTILGGKEFNSQNILETMETAYKSGTAETKNAFDAVTKMLSSADNGLAKTAKIFKAIPNTLSLVGITALLGYGIPTFNIYFTRKKIKAGQHKDGNATTNNASPAHAKQPNGLEPNLSNNQKTLISSFLQTR